MSDFLWLFGFWLTLVPLTIVILFALFVQYVLKREKQDEAFHHKMNRFRDTVQKYKLSEKVKQAIVLILFFAFLIWGASR